MSFGEGDLHAKVAELKTENARMEHECRMLRSLLGEVLYSWRKTCYSEFDLGVYVKGYEERARELGVVLDG